ncbi:histidine phosphatase family protein [Nocardiopsis sp. HUAS JQ3]|uniref:histidine phosphatase family protein n=1 Tax=Nocardiopsis sp. HUAS JQ3 TaxID=3061629 RepID=UPI0023A961C8|nr:histidine phosphatase family protein [Nocardiopsis sp. HUAS JQ3]WDZ89587.1 histidine phosphatase family protein [Nocardiopsis sp. HUAS JQ3]
MMRLFLVRHGETAWNGERRLQGQQDIGLSEAGRCQVAALAETVRYLDPGYVVTSGLCRTQETAEVLGVSPDARDPRLNEAYLADWEGRYSAQIKEEDGGVYAAWRAGRFHPPGAESFGELTDRVVEGIGAAVRRAHADGHRTLLAVTHGGPVRAFLVAAVGLDPARTVPSHPASLSIVDVDPGAASLTEPGAARLRLFNYSPAMSPLDPPD